MGFTIGSQTAQTINQVEGTQINNGGSHHAPMVVTGQSFDQIRRVLAGLSLPDTVRSAAEEHLQEAETALSGAPPHRPRAATALRHLTDVLVRAGAVATAGVALTGPLTALAGWVAAAG